MGGKGATAQTEAPPPPPSRAPCRPLPSARIIHHVFPKPCQVLGSSLAEQGPRQEEVGRADWEWKQFLGSRKTPDPQEAVTSPLGRLPTRAASPPYL